MYFGKDNKFQITEEEYDKLTPRQRKQLEYEKDCIKNGSMNGGY